MNPWIYVFGVVGATAVCDLLQSWQMKQHGRIEDFHPGRWGALLAALARRRYLILSIVFMAISFFSFLALLSVAELSFAVPATALSYVVETVLAQWLLKEHVSGARWAGTVLVASGVALLAL